MPTSLDDFHPAVRAWFERRFAAPSRAQDLGWPVIGGANAEGFDVLLCAPTGSGKTLAAFMWAINGLVLDAARDNLRDEVSVLYVSPLKALANDIRLNLEEPLHGVSDVGGRVGPRPCRESAPACALATPPPASALRCSGGRRIFSSRRPSRCSSC